MTARKRPRLEMGDVNENKLLFGAALVLMSVVMPTLANVRNFHVLSELRNALLIGEGSYIVSAALRLVALNTIRCVPHYIGAFFIAESLEFRWNGRSIQAINSVLLAIIIRCMYSVIYEVHGIQYDFGLPAIMVVIVFLAFDKLDYKYVDPIKKVLLLIVWLAAFQFLDVMPALAGLPIGRGEVSVDVKMASVVMGVDGVLNLITTVFFFILLLMGLLVFYLLRDENHLREMNALKEQNEIIRAQAQMSEIQNRTYSEMQHLVHDLKSPLTSIQTLIGVLKMQNGTGDPGKKLEILDRIELSIEQMSDMISDLLYQDRGKRVTTEEIASVVLRQISTAPYAPILKLQNEAKESRVFTNRVMLSRALVNMIENAYNAAKAREAPEITLSITREREAGKPPMIGFAVRDNGVGIAPEDLEKIWQEGFSNRTSSGLGLPFVHRVVKNAGGEIRVKSDLDRGTVMTIALPEEAEDAKGNENSDHR